MKEKLEEIIRQYEALLALSQGMAKQNELVDEEIATFVQQRESMIQDMKDRQLVLSGKEKLQLQGLMASTSLKGEEKMLLELYTRAKDLNKAVLGLDQVISLRMRKSSQEASNKLKVMNTSQKIQNYGRGFQNGVDAGERYNRLR